MNQIQVVEKTSTKCVNSSYKPQIGSPLPQQQQIASLPQQQQQEVQQQIDLVLYENYNETILPREDEILYNEGENLPPERNVTKQLRDDANQNQDIDERSGGWKDSEIKILLDYLQENFSSWFKGNKTKFYNDVVRNILPNKEPIAIKSKLARLIKKYETIKKHNNQSGIERKNWYWYDTLDLIFGTRENIAPSFLANKSTSDKIDDNKEENEVKKVGNKKQKVKSNVEVMATAIVEMNQTREKIWEKKISN
ncbi:hypothetical protein RclHR1_07790010 [Rhizophagus clarus]|uniref:Myb/SANT-like DNA-binding domain-containing protein n=1 Tax=Rhizophagus clarus TaxID=94130 RepID=A0A2Z6RXT5_9GLOM|nr:hypothetical protein RclHR1_07790010 [Rhizophagus clarus]